MADPPRILMCPPDHFGIEYEINPWMSVAHGSDPALAAAQWGALKGTLVDLGVDVDLMTPAPGLPDLVFTANAGLVYRDLFIPSRFRFGVRQGETQHFEAWARSRGFQIVEIPEGMNFEGAGDALFCGEALFAGYRFRSDVRSHQWIGERLGVEVLPMELVCPFREVHLQSGFVSRQAGAIATTGGCDGQHETRCDEGSLLAGRHPAAGGQRAVGAGILPAAPAQRAVVL